MRFKVNKKRDKSYFKRTANTTAKANLSFLVPRGGIRL